MQLRPYQRQMLAAVKDRAAAGVLRQLVVAATGLGKTVTFANMPVELNISNRMLVTVHREELAEQAAQKIAKWNPTLRVGVEMADRESSSNDDIIVASIQTLYSQNFKRLERLLTHSKLDLVVPDEAHHYVGNTYADALQRVLDRNPQALLVGFTATPNRGDGQAMGQMFDEIVYDYGILPAVKDGWLVEPRGFRLKTTTDISKVQTRAGDFAQNQLAEAVNTLPRNDEIAQGWIDYAYPRQTIAFCAGVEHAQQLALSFQKKGVPAEAIWADDPRRREKLKAHKAGDLKVLTNVGILTEGYDDWRVACVIMARPTKSQALYIQCSGRGLRIPEGVENLVSARQAGALLEKEDCLLLDVVDVTGKHSLVTLPSLFGLPRKLDMKGAGVVSAIQDFKAITANVERPEAFENVESLAEAKTIAEKVDLFEVKWDPDVEANSKLQWHKASDGSYCLLLPNKQGSVVIAEDLLGKWSVGGRVCGFTVEAESYKHEELPDAFRYAEMNVQLYGKHLITLLRREGAAWHKDPVTPAQERLLLRMHLVAPHMIAQMTKGQAAMLLNQKFSKKAG